MDISTNKSFLAGALSALSGQSIIPAKDVKTNPDPLDLGSLAKALDDPISQAEGQSITFNMDFLHKHTLQWFGDSQKVSSLPSPTN